MGVEIALPGPVEPILGGSTRRRRTLGVVHPLGGWRSGTGLLRTRLGCGRPLGLRLSGRALRPRSDRVLFATAKPDIGKAAKQAERAPIFFGGRRVAMRFELPLGDRREVLDPRHP